MPFVEFVISMSVAVERGLEEGWRRLGLVILQTNWVRLANVRLHTAIADC